MKRNLITTVVAVCTFWLGTVAGVVIDRMNPVIVALPQVSTVVSQPAAPVDESAVSLITDQPAAAEAVVTPAPPPVVVVPEPVVVVPEPIVVAPPPTTVVPPPPTVAPPPTTVAPPPTTVAPPPTTVAPPPTTVAPPPTTVAPPPAPLLPPTPKGSAHSKLPEYQGFCVKCH